MDLCGVIGPAALPPIAEAAGFQQQQVQERPLVGLALGYGGIGRHQGVEALVKGGAQAGHRLEHVGVALHPTEVVGPGGPGHGEGGIVALELSDGSFHRFRGGLATHLVPELVLLHRLNRREIAGLHASGLQ